MNAVALDLVAKGTQRRDEFAERLSTPPADVESLSRNFDAILRMVHVGLPGLETGFDADSFVWRDGRVDVAYVKLGRGAWLVFGDSQVSESTFAWYREDRGVSFTVLLRGAAGLGTPLAPHERIVYSEGCAVATACSAEMLVCRHPLAGVRYQGVWVTFDDDDAMRDFALDPVEVRRWVASGDPQAGRPDRAFRVAVGTPNLPAMRAAQAILWTSFSGSRRRLYLRSKVGEMICHLMTNPMQTTDGPARWAGGPGQGDDSLAAVVHAAISDLEDCPGIADLASRLNVPAGRLVTAFKTKYGISPRDHVLATRMARARRLLQETRVSLLDIALSCGYEHHSSFSTAYRRVFSETPLETRRAGAVS